VVAAAARSPRAAEPISAEVLARLGRPLPAPIRTAVARSDFGMVASGSPEATDAGAQILERGGNAIDAAVAAALTLGVADADASGLGGMTYMASTSISRSAQDISSPVRRARAIWRRPSS
jgi:gamma-glutamyltranspeptidase